MNSRLQKAFECSICLEFFENPRMLPCGHSYCGSPRTCLTDLLNLSDPPKCAVCKQDILVDVLDEDKLTKNFDLGSASEAMRAYGSDTQATSASETDNTKLCVNHNQPSEYFCRRCDIFICRVCWRTDHRQSADHDVIHLSMILDEYIETKESVEKYKASVEKISTSIKDGEHDLSQILEAIEEAKNRLNKISEESSGTEIRTSTQEIFAQLAGQAKSLKMIRIGLIYNINFLFEGAEESLKSSIDSMRELTLNTPGKNNAFLEETFRFLTISKHKSLIVPLIGCKKAVMDTKGNIICFGDSNDQILLAKFNLERDQLVDKGLYNWNQRKDGTILVNICMASDKLIAIVNNNKSKKVHFELLNTETLKTEKKINVQDFAIPPQDLNGLSYFISGNRNYMALFTRRGAIVLKCFILHDKKLVRVLHLDEKAGLLYHASYFLHANFFAFKTTKNVLCIVSFDDQDEGKNKKLLVQLENITEIFSVTFLATDSESRGFLCVSDDRYPNNNFKSEIYKVDLTRLEDGQKLPPIKIEERNSFNKQDIKFVAALTNSLILCRDNYQSRLTNSNIMIGYTTLKFEMK